MKKLFKAVAIVSMAAILIVVGVFAANELNFNATSLVSFTSTSAYVQIDCELLEGTTTSAGSDGFVARNPTNYPEATATRYTYNNVSNTPSTTVGDWNMGTLNFIDNADDAIYRDKFQIKMKFINNGTADIKVTFTALDGTGKDLVTLTGGFNDSGTIKTVSNNVGPGGNVEFVFVITLKEFKASITTSPKLTLPCTIETV